MQCVVGQLSVIFQPSHLRFHWVMFLVRIVMMWISLISSVKDLRDRQSLV